MKHYHYIFTGSGLSALMTVYELACQGFLNDKSVLLVDSNLKKENDRTWCYWGKTSSKFDGIVFKQWEQALFANDEFKRVLDLNPYKYNMIRGLDFYTFIFNFLETFPNIEFLNQKVIDFSDLDQHGIVKTETETFTCNKIFNSIYNPSLALSQNKYPVLQQHFVGWFIKTEEAFFNADQPTFMDFSVKQKGNTRFMYVLPTSEREALIEYTLFSKDLLPTAEYESEIEKYISNLGISEFQIIEKERGSIPMTSYPFWKHNTKNIINIGSAGGWTKASTGYTFKSTMKKSKSLAAFVQKESDFRKFHKPTRFWFYDLLLLDILARSNHRGSEIFSSMFKSSSPTLIFKFLDEETTLLEDLKVILSCPKRLFLAALLRRAFPAIKP